MHTAILQKNENHSSINKPIPTGIGTFTNSNTWSRYTYGHDFTIAYPPGWNVTESNDKSTVTFMTPGFHQDDDFSRPYGNSSEVTYAIFGEHDLSDMSLKNGDQFPNDATSETMVVTNLRKIQIDGFPAVEFDYYATDITNFIQTRISVLKNNKMYRFDSIYASNLGKQLFEKIVQTIRFV